jgi:hypothetical protein
VELISDFQEFTCFINSGEWILKRWGGGDVNIVIKSVVFAAGDLVRSYEVELRFKFQEFICVIYSGEWILKGCW